MAIKRKFPGAVVKIDVSDVAGAFNNLDMAPKDVWQFAVEMPLRAEEPPPLGDLVGTTATPRTRAIVGQATNRRRCCKAFMIFLSYSTPYHGMTVRNIYVTIGQWR